MMMSSSFGTPGDSGSFETRVSGLDSVAILGAVEGVGNEVDEYEGGREGNREFFGGETRELAGVCASEQSTISRSLLLSSSSLSAWQVVLCSVLVFSRLVNAEGLGRRFRGPSSDTGLCARLN